MNHPRKSRTILVPRSALPGCDTAGRSISAYITAAAAVFALVLAMAMPAHAGKKNDLAKALIAALVIGAIVKETNRAEAAPAPVPVPVPAPVSQTRVPAVCAISIEGAERDVTLFPESCMRNEGFNARLPRGCATEARIFGRDDRVYSAQCLRDAGFRTSGR